MSIMNIVMSALSLVLAGLTTGFAVYSTNTGDIVNGSTYAAAAVVSALVYIKQ